MRRQDVDLCQNRRDKKKSEVKLRYDTLERKRDRDRGKEQHVSR